MGGDFVSLSIEGDFTNLVGCYYYCAYGDCGRLGLKVEGERGDIPICKLFTCYSYWV